MAGTAPAISLTEAAKEEKTSMSAAAEKVAKSHIRYSRIFKKSSQDGNLVLFLPQRELKITEKTVEPLMGVAMVHENAVSKGLRAFVQIVLVFRYGREDEELMGLRFCNEIVVAADQVYPQMDFGGKNKDRKGFKMKDKRAQLNNHTSLITSRGKCDF